MPRIIFHIDVNSAFLSWSAVKLVLEGKPDIRLVPSVVSGDPNDRRSIITAASIPAKKLGIKTAMPVSMALRICPNLVIVGGDWNWYKQCSEGFIAICRSYSPVLQQFSIDECFIDMSLRCTPEKSVAVATKLKDQVKSTFGFTVNVGIGSNKLLAKMASDFEKPDKVHTLWESEVKEKMWPLGVRDLLWVGKKTEERLTAYGIHTIGQLANLGMGSLTRLVGQKFAQQLHENANGRDDSPVETERAEAKSISAERTFSKDLVDPKDIEKALFNVACIVAHRLRRHNFRASTVSVFVKYKDFSVAQKQCQTDRPTDITAVILNEARRLISEAWDGTTPIRQVGLGVSKLTHESVEQMSLFEDPKMEYYREWDRQYDEQMALKEDARTLAYENAHGPQGSRETPPPPTATPPGAQSQRARSGGNLSMNSSQRKKTEPDVLLFRYSTGEEALLAAKKRVKGDHSLRFHRSRLDDGTDCFEVVSESKVIERYCVDK